MMARGKGKSKGKTLRKGPSQPGSTWMQLAVCRLPVATCNYFVPRRVSDPKGNNIPSLGLDANKLYFVMWR